MPNSVFVANSLPVYVRASCENLYLFNVHASNYKNSIKLVR